MDATIELQVNGVTVPGKKLINKVGQQITITGTALIGLDADDVVTLKITNNDPSNPIRVVGGASTVDIHELRVN